jgi:hypothetical protein
MVARPPGEGNEDKLWDRTQDPRSTQRCGGVDSGYLAEVDGNRTRRRRDTATNRFEGGGAHQVPLHLRERR